MLMCVVVFVFGCNSAGHLRKKYVGKQFNATHFNDLEMNGTHSQKTEHYDFAYDYTIDPQQQHIQLDGTMVYNKTADESLYHSETVLMKVDMMEVRVFFADEYGKVNGVETFYIKPGKNIFDPLDFNQTLPFRSDYKHILLSYNALLQGD